MRVDGALLLSISLIAIGSWARVSGQDRSTPVGNHISYEDQIHVEHVKCMFQTISRTAVELEALQLSPRQARSCHRKRNMKRHRTRFSQDLGNIEIRVVRNPLQKCRFAQLGGESAPDVEHSLIDIVNDELSLT